LPHSSKKNTSFDTRSLLGTHHTHLYLPETPPYSLHIHSVHLPVKSEPMLHKPVQNRRLSHSTVV